MGFSVTAANVIFAFAMLTAFSAALGSYWKTQDHVEESRRIQDARIVEAAHVNLSAVGTPTYDAGADTYVFTIKNTGSVGLDYTKFQYLVDGVITFSITSGWPKLNGAASTSDLLLPGDTLEVKLDNVASSPSRHQVVTEYGIVMHYP